ncbi:MAG: leucyl/phenylalanyl-tRNA--protein transferase [Lysobacteraceae bacterium]|nr:MAG: leucyl/phenylalanyl-tRNA--protein transferase [Xanthomonadaceae bacterium]
MIRLPWLDPADPDAFPPVGRAMEEPDGLLAAGGDLSPARLLAAYRRGVFPWYSEDEPILWWSPARRTVFDTATPHVPRRLARWLRGCDWTIRTDNAFGAVMRACAHPRRDAGGTWIGASMIAAYERLHRLGHAHSVEAWDGRDLVGGIYGVRVGRMFYGESMFSAAGNGSKVALLALCRLLDERGCPLLDAQVASPHLFTLGAREMPRAAFCAEVARLADLPFGPPAWPSASARIKAAALAASRRE